MNVLLLEDNKIQLEFLYQKIYSRYLDIKVFKAETLKEALEMINTNYFELLFVDIILQDGTGLEFAEKLRNIPQYKFTPLVFCTTEESLITSSFKKYHCYDYIVKPFKINEIYQIIDIMLENSTTNSEHSLFIEAEKGCIIKINLRDILYVEARGKDVMIFTVNDNYLVKNKSLSKFLKKIDNSIIIRCHKSYAVNIKEIRKIERVSSRVRKIYLLNSEDNVYISSTYLGSIEKKIEPILI